MSNTIIGGAMDQNKKRRVYKMEVDENDESPVFGMSMVENPAIEVEWIALSKQASPKLDVQLAVSDNDKRELIGLALVPDMAIPRIDEETKEEYDIYFTQDTVRKAAYKFVAAGMGKNVTLEHAKDIKGKAEVVESWLVEDAVMDKTQKYGLNAPVGSWAIKMKVKDEELWQEVKLGNIKGFSLEGAFKHKLQNPDNIEMSTQRKQLEILEQLKELLKQYDPSND